jgi:tetratricopeptide (TPR) repeat protein
MWSCSLCTFANRVEDDNCSMCTTIRPQETPPPLPVFGSKSGKGKSKPQSENSKKTRSKSNSEIVDPLETPPPLPSVGDNKSGTNTPKGRLRSSAPNPEITRIGALLERLGQSGDINEKDIHKLAKVLGDNAYREPIIQGHAAFKDGKYCEALSHFQCAADILTAIQPASRDTSETMASLYCNIGSVHDKLGDKTLALEFSHRARRIYEEVLDDRSSKHVATIYNNIGALYIEINDYINAVSYLQRSFDIRKLARTPVMADAATKENCDATGRMLNQAKSMMALTCGEFPKVLDKDTAIMCAQFANQLEEQEGKSEDIVKLFTLAAEYFDATQDWDRLASCYNNLGSILKRQEKYADRFDLFVLSLVLLIVYNTRNGQPISLFFTSAPPFLL